MVTATFISLSSVAQLKRHSVKVDLLDALAVKTLELSYEYYLGGQSAVGVSGLLNFEKRSSDFRYNEKRMLTPYFRHYFSSYRRWNYFGEIFFGINYGEYRHIKNNIIRYEMYTDGALGVVAGTKYNSNAGFIIDAHIGLGRNLLTNKSPIIVPRIGVNVGYQF